MAKQHWHARCAERQRPAQALTEQIRPAREARKRAQPVARPRQIDDRRHGPACSDDLGRDGGEQRSAPGDDGAAARDHSLRFQQDRRSREPDHPRLCPAWKRHQPLMRARRRHEARRKEALIAERRHRIDAKCARDRPDARRAAPDDRRRGDPSPESVARIVIRATLAGRYGEARRRRAIDLPARRGRLVQQNDRQAGAARRQCGGGPGRACPDDDEIGLMRLGHSHVRPRLSARPRGRPRPRPGRTGAGRHRPEPRIPGRRP